MVKTVLLSNQTRPNSLPFHIDFNSVQYSLHVLHLSWPSIQSHSSQDTYQILLLLVAQLCPPNFTTYETLN